MQKKINGTVKWNFTLIVTSWILNQEIRWRIAEVFVGIFHFKGFSQIVAISLQVFFLFICHLVKLIYFYSLKYNEDNNRLSLHPYHHWLPYWLGDKSKLCVLGKKRKNNLHLCQCSTLWRKIYPYDNEKFEEKM